MKFSSRVVNAAASRNTPRSFVTTLAQLNSADIALFEHEDTVVSMTDSFCGEPSQNAYVAKVRYEETIPQAGYEYNDKLRRRADYRKKAHDAHNVERKRWKNGVWLKRQNYRIEVADRKSKALPTVFEDMCQEQFGFEQLRNSISLADTLLQFTGVKSSDNIIHEIEDILTRLYIISDCKSMHGICAVIFNYIHSKLERSIASSVVEYISTLIGYSPQDGLENTYEEPEWIRLMKSMRNNWTECRGNGMFDNFCKILGIITVAGLAQVSDLTFSIGKFKIIEPDLRMLSSSASDLTTAFCDIVIYFCERCHQCWTLKSFRPMFSSSLETAELEVEYTTICNNWDLYKSGNLWKIHKISEHDFLRSIESLGSKLKTMIPTLKGIDKRLIEDKYRNIVKIIGAFTIIKVNSGFRRAPFALEYYGVSKVGKSTVSEQIAHYLFTSAGLDSDAGRKFTHVSGKKHWDGARSDMLELKLDDHANTKQEYVESSPCDVIIKVCNNVPYSPPMADLGDKGKVWIQPELVSLTTNVRDLDARVYSNNPYSIQRRMHYVIEVMTRDEFTESKSGVALGIDTTKVIASHTKDGVYDPPSYHDVWVLNIKVAIPGVNEKVAGTYVPAYDDNGKMLVGISMQQACNFLCDKFHKHREEQFKLERSQNITRKEVKCGVDGCHQVRGYCLKHPICEECTEQLGIEQLTSSLGNLNLVSNVRDQLDEARSFYTEYRYLPYMPEFVIRSRVFKYSMAYANRQMLKERYVQLTKCNGMLFSFFMAMSVYHSQSNLIATTSCMSILLLALLAQWWLVHNVRERYFEELAEQCTLTEIQRAWKDDVTNKICVAGGALATIYLMSKAYKKWYALQDQGSLEPKTQKEIDQRDSEVNVWTQVSQRPLPLSDKSKTMTSDKLRNAIEKNLLYGSIHLDDGTNGMMNCLALTSNVLMVPYHYFDKFGGELNCTLRKKNPETCGGKFAVRLNINAAYVIPNTDMALCYSPTGGSFKNIIEYFPMDHMPTCSFKMVWRQKDGTILEGKGLTNPGIVSTTKPFRGGMYAHLNMNTFGGLCGAVLYSDTVGSGIVGLHLGGRDGTPCGCYGSFTQGDLSAGLEFLRGLDGVILSGQAGNFERKVLGVEILTGQPLHPKSPVNYMPEDSQVEWYGSTIGHSKFSSDVKVSLMSEHITDVFNRPNIYCPPVIEPQYLGWQDCLANLAVPAHPYPYDLLVTAINDYKEPLVPIFKSDLWNKSRPLTDHENLCGIPGKKFMDSIKLGTSIGFPLSGEKRRFVTELEPTEDKPNNRVLDQVIMDEINRCEECYRRGERAYPIAKACKKDEILSKKKCRIFYGNAMALTYLIRKYYLPILRVLQMNPIKSECAVGINAHGPEWEEFYTHAMKFGEDRVFGGDYGKYDQKLPSQLIFAALRIMIDFARECDYSEEDLRIMEAMTGDIVFAVIAFNGDLIGLTEGTHISGNSLTVVINGICGSLNLRCFFYSQYKPKNFCDRMVFRDWVAAMTYGDDNIGSVREGAEKFNIRECSQFLAKYGQVYTMPDKTSELQDYLPMEEWEFLKRTSVYHPALGCHVGALVEKSIFKSLHMYLRGKGCPISEEQACAQNLDTADRELWNHGEKVYNEYKPGLREVAARMGISHMCSRLDMSYADGVVDWKEKYGNQYEMYDSPNSLTDYLDDD